MKRTIFARRLQSLIAGMMCLCAVLSHAATFTVSNTTDTGAGSLRQAITDALAGGAGPHDIQAGGVTGTISLQTALPVIANTNIAIHGPTSGTLTVTRGTGTFRIFNVNNSGGAASLTVNRVQITNGSETNGGCIAVSNATLNLNFCTVSGGNAVSGGGGIHITGTVASTVNIRSCTISGNTSGNAQGGGIFCNDGNATGSLILNITDSTLSGNHTTLSSGGGLFINRTVATLRNCTISGNRANFNAGGVSIGSSAATLNAINCTITNNTCDAGSTGGGGMRGSGTGGSVANLINTIVVGNFLDTTPNDTSWNTGTRTAINSVVGVNADNTFNTVTASQIGTLASPKVVNLGALANNGGPTQTHALLASAPELAINLGSNVDAFFANDQRGVGYNRNAGGTVDIGAFETGVTAPSFTGVSLLGAPASATASNTLSFTVPPGTNRLLVVVASHADSAGVNFTGVTFGASALTLAGVKTDGSTAADSIWYLPLGTATTATTATITATPPAGQEATHFLAALAFQNAHQTTPTSGFVSTNNTGAGTNPTVSVTSAAGDLVLDLCDLWTSNITTPITRVPGAGQTNAVLVNAPITNPPSSYTGFGCYSISLEPGAASTTMNWTTSYEAMILAGVNIKQAPVALSNNADLSALTTTATGMTPAFGAATTGYNATVPNGTTTTTVTAARAEANATLAVQVNGGGFTTLTSGVASGNLSLNVGANPIDVRVTAQDTTTKTYTLIVTRATPALTPNRISGPVPPATIMNVNCGIAMLSNGGHADLYLQQTGGDQVSYLPAPAYIAKVVVYDATNTLIGTFNASEAVGTESVLTASISALVNGGFVVAWTSQNSDGVGTGPAYYEVFNNNGIAVDPVGSRHRAVSADNTHIGGYGIQVAGLAGGGFTVVYYSGASAPPLAQRDFVCTFSYGGNLTSFTRVNESYIGDTVNTVTTAEGLFKLFVSSPGMRIAALPDGSFVVEEATYVYFGPNYTPLGDHIYKFTSAGLPANFASGFPQVRVNWNNGGRSFDIVSTGGGAFASVNQNLPGNFEMTLFNADGSTLTTNTLTQQVFQNGSLGPRSYKAVTIAPWVTRNAYNGPDQGTLIALTKTGTNLVVAMNSAAGFGIATYLAADGTQLGPVVNSPLAPTPGGAYLLNPRLASLGSGQWAITYDDYSFNLTTFYSTASTYEYGFVASSAAPEIAVTETGIGNVADGGTFAFGTTTVGSPVTKTFTVTNSGTGILNLSALTVPSGFTIAAGFGSSTVAANGGTTTFQITMSAGAAATPSGTLSFTNDDADENPYNFTISGTVNPAPVTVTSLNRVNAATTNLSTVNWTLTFGTVNAGVSASNFSLSGAAAAGAVVGSPSTGNGGLTWNVPVTTGSTDGALTLSLANATGTTPGVSTTLPFTTAGQSYTMDKTLPTVLSIVRQTPTSQATSSTSATFRVTFSEAVNAPAASNFAITPVSSSITGTIGTVTAVNASTYDVPVTITGGSGEFRLKIID